MNTQRGIALVSSLLTMAAIMALGVGSIFLSRTNLQISENARSNSAARYQAEAGLETAAALLSDWYERYKVYPTTFTLPVIPGHSYSIDDRPGDPGYQRFSNPDRVRVRVLGMGPNNSNSRYVAEAVFVSDVYYAFKIGLASEGLVRVSGGGNAEYRNAGVHGNAGVRLPGVSTSNFRTCGEDQTWSACTIASPVPVTSSPTASDTLTSCEPAGCNNRAKPISIEPEYLLKRNKTIREAHVANGVISSSNSNPAIMDNNHNNQMRCTTVYTSTPATITSVTPGSVICMEGSGSINFAENINLTGVTVISDGHINFGNRRAGTLTDVKLISKNGGVMMDAVTGVNLTIFSNGNNATGSVTDGNAKFTIPSTYNLRGATTIASTVDIVFSGTTQITTRPNNSKVVTVAVISERTITNNGSTPFYGVFWAGTGFEQKGSSSIVGSVAVRDGNIGITGKLMIDASYAVDNDYLKGGTSIMSRR